MIFHSSAPLHCRSALYSLAIRPVIFINKTFFLARLRLKNSQGILNYWKGQRIYPYTNLGRCPGWYISHFFEISNTKFMRFIFFNTSNDVCTVYYLFSQTFFNNTYVKCLVLYNFQAHTAMDIRLRTVT